MELVFTSQMSKVKQLADALSHEISIGEYAPGDPLPSINGLSRQYGVSRDTVFKAFNELKMQGIVDSAPTKGYYVSNAVHRILLLLDTYSPFKYQLHDAITRNLAANYKIDLYFHQRSEELFTKIIRDPAIWGGNSQPNIKTLISNNLLLCRLRAPILSRAFAALRDQVPLCVLPVRGRAPSVTILCAPGLVVAYFIVFFFVPPEGAVAFRAFPAAGSAAFFPLFAADFPAVAAFAAVSFAGFPGVLAAFSVVFPAFAAVFRVAEPFVFSGAGRCVSTMW